MITKDDRGITLVALIITIIVLIILAAVTIRAVVKNGMVDKAVAGVENYADDQYKEVDSFEEISQKIDNTVDNIITQQMASSDKEKPEIIQAIGLYNSINLIATDSDSGIVGYAITRNNTKPTKFTSCSATNQLSITITDLYQGTTYYVWVKDRAGNISDSRMATTRRVVSFKADILDAEADTVIDLTISDGMEKYFTYSSDGKIEFLVDCTIYFSNIEVYYITANTDAVFGYYKNKAPTDSSGLTTISSTTQNNSEFNLKVSKGDYLYLELKAMNSSSGESGTAYKGGLSFEASVTEVN